MSILRSNGSSDFTASLSILKFMPVLKRFKASFSVLKLHKLKKRWTLGTQGGTQEGRHSKELGMGW